MLLFWCSWFKHRFIKLDLVTVGKLCFHFSRVLGRIVDCVNVNPARAWRLNHGLRDAQKVWALTKVGTVLKLRVRLSRDFFLMVFTLSCKWLLFNYSDQAALIVHLVLTILIGSFSYIKPDRCGNFCPFLYIFFNVIFCFQRTCYVDSFYDLFTHRPLYRLDHVEYFHRLTSP